MTLCPASRAIAAAPALSRPRSILGFVELAKFRFSAAEDAFRGAATLDRLGGTMLFPFFALYVTEKFGVGMTEAGLLLGIFALAGLAGGMVGGALADKIGRRSLVIFGLIFSALGSVAMGFVTSLPAFYALAVVVGFLGDIAGPAHGAMVADMLPEEQRGTGFAMQSFFIGVGAVIAGMLPYILKNWFHVSSDTSSAK